MYFQIRYVVLWSNHRHLEPRLVKFELGMVNVVMGGSRTGKSAIIPIIDYCLGSSSCAIPKKAIRTACSWFGIVLETREGQKLLARKNPEQNSASYEMFVLEGNEIQIPKYIEESNSSPSAVKRKLDELCSLSNLDFSGGDVTRHTDHRVSFRDLMAFTFQPQNVVANRDVLGILSPSILAAQHEVEHLKRELRRKERDLSRAKEASNRWESEMAGHLDRARELGLIQDDGTSDLTKDAMLALLRSVAKKTVDDFHADSSTITKAVEQLSSLETAEAKITDDLAALKSRQSELGRLREGAGGFRDALALQRDRLEISKWLREQSGGGGCPICGSEGRPSMNVLHDLAKNYAEIEATSNTISEIPTAVDREVQDLRNRIDNNLEKLSAIRRHKKALGETSSEAKNRQFQSLTIAHFLGQLTQAIHLYDEVGDDGELASDIVNLNSQIKKIDGQINKAEIERRKTEALGQISDIISKLMPLLDNDHHLDKATLVLDDLTLQITGDDGDSFLWNIGSGSNWLSYHLSIMLALQTFFLKTRDNPVPGLLVFDQPSQVYFPEQLVRRSTDKVSEPEWNSDEDKKAVRLAFTLLGKVVKEHAGNLQIIVLDHAPLEVWEHLSNVTLAANWRTGEKLVPTTWPGADE